MFEEKAKCIDCGKEFLKRSIMQVRCPECQETYKRERNRIRKREQYEKKRVKKKTDGAVYVNGHPQVCEYLGSCFYGSESKNGCSYILETGHSRIKQGLFIVDGKCPAYTKKGKHRRKMDMYSFADKPIEKHRHNFMEV